MNSSLAISWLPIAAVGLLVLFIVGIILLYRQNKKEGPYVHYSNLTEASDIPPGKDKKEYYFFPLQKSGLSDYSSFLRAYLLKWISEDVIKADEGSYVLEGSPVFKSNHERDWFVLLNKLPGGILLMEPEFRKEQERAIRENQQNIRTESIDFLRNNDFIKTETTRVMSENVDHFSYTEKGMKLQKDLIAYRNYLNTKDKVTEEEFPWISIYGLDYKELEFQNEDNITKEQFDWAKRFSDFYKKVS